MGYPNFTRYGYRISQELGANRAGGRVTYLATDIETLKKVVIKQFQFASTQANWSGFDAHKREIEVLRDLDHPGICRYLHSFQTQDGFCLVQEYKNALPLSIARSFDFGEIQQIAIAVLEILIYLQSRIPPVIHRDIKPENILVDEQLNVYLIDFGFARVGKGEVGISSVVKGTLGFMPPEQLFNRELSEASDLYGLGMTLICLLTNTKSSEIGNLVDVTYRINFKQSLPKVNSRWIAWLEKMVEPKATHRFANAAIALAELPKQPIYLPEVLLSQAEILLKAIAPRQKLGSVVSITNFAPGTCLEGRWEIAQHPGDLQPQAQQHPWIAIEPMEFIGNQIECHIAIDTSRLMAGKIYRRELLLHSNAADRKQSLLLQVQTASARLQARRIPVGLLALLFVVSSILAWILTWIVVIACTVPSVPAGFGAFAGAAVGLEVAAWLLSAAGAGAGAVVGSTAGVVAGLLALFIVATENLYDSMPIAIAAALIGGLGGLAFGGLTGVTAELFARKSGNHRLSITLTLVTAAAAVSIGLVQAVGFSHPLLLAGVAASWLPFVAIASYLPLARLRLVQEQRDTQPQFKP
ncbi:serine/threonine protein kinase [Microcoleus sp. FACHB-1515]|uniref:serine/threonine protein kinase n=1 Tax=Cyanophyceae TaxID=3028117 RepID=UPI0016896925|nr:serine/threonine-protein kinase [Microcoleus sp. FACHB-1515]MBD2090410.1 serine/threonine protein kinase [Microcoleus sp. FACHB-1515]